MLRLFKWLLLLITVLAVAFLFWVYSSTFHPDDVMHEPIVSPAALPRLQAGQRVKILSWNVQFMAGNADNHFFYDDGPDPWPSKQRIEQTLTQAAAFIRAQNPDLVLLQEVDDLADRTHLFDQTQGLLELLPDYQAYTETFYWKADYLPHPQINGRVGMKLVVLSKVALGEATRYALPLITTDDIITRQFNLKRAMQQVRVPVEGGADLVVINTHLSAFAKGSDTMQRQIDAVMQRLDDLQGKPWVMGGDFNLLPNEAALDAFEEKRSAYNDQGTEIAPLIASYPSVPALVDIERNPEPWFTYMSPTDPRRNPNRTIDYIFYANNLSKVRGKVLRGDALVISDHLPILLEVQL